MLVEDNPGDARLIQEMLKVEAGKFVLHTFATLSEATAAVDTVEPHAILLDLLLPDSHGLDTLRDMLEACPDTAILVLTGMVDQELGVRAVNEGAQDYLVKGEVDARLLGRAIRYAVQRKKVEQAEMEQRRFAEALAETARLLTSTLELSDVLDRIMGALKQVVPNDMSNIMLLDRDEMVAVVRRRGYGDNGNGPREEYNLLDLDDIPILKQMLTTRQPLWIENLMLTGDALTPIMYFGLQHGMQAYAGAPIIARGRVLGFLNIYCKEARAYGTVAAGQLLSFAEQAAVGLENARLFQQASKLAAAEERQRLARDLHDSVSQTLFTTSALAESALRQWDHNPARAQELLKDVYRLSQAAQAEMRVLLLELRPHTIASMGLNSLINQLVKPIHARRGLDIQVSLPEKIDLPARVQTSLYRIVQEALNNIEKHALASQVEISLTVDEAQTVLRIADDGQGFATVDVREGSMGMGIMTERAQSMGGTLSLTSTPGQGTTIIVTLDTATLMVDEG